MSSSFEVTAGAIIRAIRSCPNGSAGGPDKLRPQHLKDMLVNVEDVVLSHFSLDFLLHTGA